LKLFLISCAWIKNKSSTFLSGYCTPQEGYIEPFIAAASCGVFWKVLDKKSSPRKERRENKKRSLLLGRKRQIYSRGRFSG